ncbi:MAG: GAF domain-containing protein, partial [Syntrophales bacterium]|nr:GAF domain-containing protein [Syntrophales bacterium]
MSDSGKGEQWLDKLSIARKGLYYKLTIIFGLFFLVPVLGFLVFAFHYSILQDEHLPLYILSILVFSFFGLSLLRNIFDEINTISKTISRDLPSLPEQGEAAAAGDELGLIVRSFQVLERELRETLGRLEEKSADIATLKELAELCFVTMSDEDLLAVTLERALKLTGADVGSVMIVEGGKRENFVIEASIGLGEYGKKGTVVPFEDSVAKYAVINRSPLLVDDIEKDMRFGRKSRPHYGTKSFICMPLKTMNDVIGVITLSRRKSDAPFTEADIDVLTPLIGNASFTYDNLRLLKENKLFRDNVHSLAVLFGAMNSPLRQEELLRTVMQEARKLIGTDLIVILEKDAPQAESLTVIDFNASFPTNLKKGMKFPCCDTVLERVLNQNIGILVGLDEADEMPEGLFYIPGVLSCLVMPLKTEGVPSGVVIFYNIGTQEWIRMAPLIDLIRDSVSLVRHHNRLVAYVQRRTRELETLRMIGNALSSYVTDKERMLNYTMTMVRYALHVEAGYLALVEEGCIHFVAALQLDLAALKKVNLTWGEDIVGYVANRGMPVLTNDAPRYPHYSPTIEKATGFSVHSVLAVP